MDNDPVQIKTTAGLSKCSTNCWRAVRHVGLGASRPKRLRDRWRTCYSVQHHGLAGISAGVHSEALPHVPTEIFANFGKTLLCQPCPKCRVIYGDFYLQDEPSAPFFPTEAEEARLLQMETVPLSRAIFMHYYCGYGIGKLILRNARRCGRTSG